MHPSAGDSHLKRVMHWATLVGAGLVLLATLAFRWMRQPAARG